jgi:hypothetical protein
MVCPLLLFLAADGPVLKDQELADIMAFLLSLKVRSEADYDAD